MGLCKIGAAAQYKFEDWSWQGIGHGNYCIGSYGRVFSHCDRKINGEVKCFKYASGDVLRFKYNTAKGKLVLKKGDCNFEMDILKANDYAFCVYLCN